MLVDKRHRVPVAVHGLAFVLLEHGAMAPVLGLVLAELPVRRRQTRPERIRPAPTPWTALIEQSPHTAPARTTFKLEPVLPELSAVAEVTPPAQRPALEFPCPDRAPRRPCLWIVPIAKYRIGRPAPKVLAPELAARVLPAATGATIPALRLVLAFHFPRLAEQPAVRVKWAIGEIGLLGPVMLMRILEAGTEPAFRAIPEVRLRDFAVC